MIGKLKEWRDSLVEWYGDIRFPAARWRHTAEIKNAYSWHRKHMCYVYVKPEIKEWLENNVEGRYIIHEDGFELSPSLDPLNVCCLVSFSRESEAIMFKLACS